MKYEMIACHRYIDFRFECSMSMFFILRLIFCAEMSDLI